ncbi:MAG: EamA family transporter, partial [Lachnospiraceae bacterium]|nr:EamA family transporter [Lachnospiraceae bacterium]
PLGSITYVWTMLISKFLLKEDITKRKLLGMAVIICGVILLALGQV